MTAPFYHFSVDDVFRALLPAPGRSARSTHGLLGFLEDLHRRYGTRTDLYLFQQQREIDLGMALRSGNSHRQFRRMTWLRFGPHAQAYDLPPHAQAPADFHRSVEAIYAAIDRFAGAERRSQWVRLHYFSETLESAAFLRRHGIEALLTTDKPAIAYRLPEPARLSLSETGRATYDGMLFVRSHFRIEDLVRDGLAAAEVATRIDRCIQTHGFVVLFTHEIDLEREVVRRMTMACMECLKSRGIPSL